MKKIINKLKAFIKLMSMIEIGKNNSLIINIDSENYIELSPYNGSINIKFSKMLLNSNKEYVEKQLIAQNIKNIEEHTKIYF
jgi:hypothetical protein